MNKKKVIISACLLGEYCRYDGKKKQVNAVIEAFKEYEIIPFCPEAPLFGTPRERIDVVKINGENKIITHTTKVDVTSLLKEEINSFCKEHPHVDAIVLKSKSPSCGYQTTPVFNENAQELSLESGIAASMMHDFYKELTIKDESAF